MIIQEIKELLKYYLLEYEYKRPNSSALWPFRLSDTYEYWILDLPLLVFSELLFDRQFQISNNYSHFFTNNTGSLEILMTNTC